MEAENFFELFDCDLDYCAENDAENGYVENENSTGFSEQSIMQKIEVYREERCLKSFITEVFDD